MTETISAVLPSSAELGEALEQVWSSFLDGEIIVIPEGETDVASRAALVASVSISGGWSGHVMLMVGKDCANKIASSMFEMDVAEMSTAEVADALGEIANMVGGTVKSMVGVAATLSLPQVVLDASALVNPETRRLTSVAAYWSDEPIEVSLWERSANGRSTSEGAQ